MLFKKKWNWGRETVYNSLDKEEFRGYDLRTKSEIEERIIEIKSFKTTGKIILSSNEWRIASENPDHYYLYVVRNALTDPEIKKLKDPFKNLQGVAVAIPKDDYTINIKFDDLNKIIDEKPPNLEISAKKPVYKEKNVFNDMKNSLKSSNFVDWIETLPFPLASILWKYYATKDDSESLDILLNFFEAVSEFNFTLMNSMFSEAIKYNNFIFQEEFFSLIEKYPKYPWFEKPTFGNWTILGKNLARIIRNIRNSSNKDKWSTFLESTGQTEEFVMGITNRKL